MDCYCDFDGPEVFTEKIRTARKAHRCCECHESIEPGESYEWVKGLWDGQWFTFKTCQCCQEDRQRMSDADVCWTYGGLQEEWENLWYGTKKIDGESSKEADHERQIQRTYAVSVEGN